LPRAIPAFKIPTFCSTQRPTVSGVR